AYIALPPMSRSILDATMRRLQVDVDDPPVKHLAERTQQDYGLPARIVIITFQDVAERRSRVAVHQIVAHRALKSFKLALVPGHENFRILDVRTNLQTRAFEVAGMELWGIIDDYEFRHAVTFPAVLDPRNLALYVGLWE